MVPYPPFVCQSCVLRPAPWSVNMIAEGSFSFGSVGADSFSSVRLTISSQHYVVLYLHHFSKAPSRRNGFPCGDFMNLHREKCFSTETPWISMESLWISTERNHPSQRLYGDSTEKNGCPWRLLEPSFRQQHSSFATTCNHYQKLA